MHSHDKKNDRSFMRTIAGWLSACVLFIIFLETTSWIWISRLPVYLCAAYCLYSVWTQGKKWWLKRRYKATHRERFLKLLASFMCLFFFVGMALYVEVLHLSNTYAGVEVVNAELLLRAAMESLSLFMFKVNGILLANIKQHVYLRGMVSIMSLLAFMCTIAVLVNLAYSRLLSYIKITRKTHVDAVHNHIYMFVGMNQPSRLLAYDIAAHDAGRAIIIALDHIHEKDEEEGGWNSIVKFFTMRKQTYSEIEEVDARIAFIDSPLYELRIEQDGDADIFELVNLTEIRTLLQKLKDYDDSELHIFFLSENEEENIRSLGVMVRDVTINAMTRRVKERLYYHARRNGLNRVIEDIALKKELDVCIVDSAHITVEQLKVNDDYHPVHLVDVSTDNPTTVSSPFSSLIIGFNEVGQDALNFLYEYAAFVDSRSNDDNVMRSPFQCIAVDSKMDEMKGRFSEFLCNFENSNAPGHPVIRLEQYDYHTQAFFKNILEPNARTLNYIIIAVGDDENSMSCAIGIFKFLRKCRSDLSRLRIFVRAYDYEKEKYMRNIAAHYNEGYNTDCTSPSFRTPEVIIPFGRQKDVYSYEMIVNDKLISCGRRFQERYVEMSSENDMWKQRREKLLGFKDKQNHEIARDERRVSLNNIRSLRRKEFQDVSNAFHGHTKLYLLKEALNGRYDDFDWDYFFLRYFDVDGVHANKRGRFTDIVYPELSPFENVVIRNLAWLEHERWIASHQTLGYITARNKDAHFCDEEKMEHNCLIPWQELDRESVLSSTPGWQCDYKNYDYGVVDVTIQLYKENLLK